MTDPAVPRSPQQEIAKLREALAILEGPQHDDRSAAYDVCGAAKALLDALSLEPALKIVADEAAPPLTPEQWVYVRQRAVSSLSPDPRTQEPEK